MVVTYDAENGAILLTSWEVVGSSLLQLPKMVSIEIRYTIQIALPASFSVPPVAVVSPPLYDVMGSGHVTMEVMR